MIDKYQHGQYTALAAKHKSSWKRAALKRQVLSCLLVMPAAIGNAWAAVPGVVPDKAAGKHPQVTQAADGTPVVNIRTPDKNELSHNQYKDLQVGKKASFSTTAARMPRPSWQVT